MSTPDDDDESPDGPEGAPTRSELQMLVRAIKQRWPMPDKVRVRVLNRLCRIIDDEAWDDSFQVRPSHREVIAAARALLAADALNMEQEKRDQAIPDRIVHEHHFAQLTDAQLVERVKGLARGAAEAGPAPAP